MDGVWQHDPLYPTECDENGNINNKIEILATAPADSPQDPNRIADEAVESVPRGDVSIQEEKDNIYRQTEANQGDLPTGEKAGTDTASVNCQGESKC